MTSVSRRTVAKGAAWAVPVVAVGAATPAMAASVCEPVFVVTNDSRKCCNGKIKNMKVVFEVTDPTNCLDPNADVCISQIELGNGQSPGTVVFDNQCAKEGGTITAYLLDTDSCTVNLVLSYTVAGGPLQIAEVKSDNIPGGNSDAECCPEGNCTPPA